MGMASSSSSSRHETFVDNLIAIIQCRQIRLPPDIIQYIINYADLLNVVVARRLSHRGETNEDRCAMTCCLKVPRNMRRFFMPSKVIVRVESKDQGWTSHQTPGLRESHTWTELGVGFVGMGGNDGPEPGGPLYVSRGREFCSRNITAGSEYEIQTKVFNDDSVSLDALRSLWGEYVESIGSIEYLELQLWSRSRYPGWVNFIKRAQMEIHFDVVDFLTLSELYTSRYKSGELVRV